MLKLVNDLMSRDPITFLSAFAVWSFLSGVSFLLPGNAFTISRAYEILQQIYYDDTVWGAIMTLDGIMILVAIRLLGPPSKAAIVLISGVIWGLIGTAITAASAADGFFSVFGAFSVYCAACSVVAVGQILPHHDAGGTTGYGDR